MDKANINQGLSMRENDELKKLKNAYRLAKNKSKQYDETPDLSLFSAKQMEQVRSLKKTDGSQIW